MNRICILFFKFYIWEISHRVCVRPACALTLSTFDFCLGLERKKVYVCVFLSTSRLYTFTFSWNSFLYYCRNRQSLLQCLRQKILLCPDSPRVLAQNGLDLTSFERGLDFMCGNIGGTNYLNKKNNNYLLNNNLSSANADACKAAYFLSEFRDKTRQNFLSRSVLDWNGLFPKPYTGSKDVLPDYGS